IATETGWVASRCVPHTIGHHHVIAGAASIGIVLVVASFGVGCFFPRGVCFKKLASTFHGCWQRSAFIKVTFAQPGIELAAMLSAIRLELVIAAGIATVRFKGFTGI